MRHQIYYAVKNKTLINYSACRSFSLLRCDIISREGIKFINNEVVFIYVMILHHCTTLICNIRRNLFLVNILFCVLASVRHSQVQSKIKISKTFNVISLCKAGGWGNTGWHKTNGLPFIQSFIWKAVNISLIGWNSWHFRINRPCFYTWLIKPTTN